jgi:hypothetical protein
LCRNADDEVGLNMRAVIDELTDGDVLSEHGDPPK